MLIVLVRENPAKMVYESLYVRAKGGWLAGWLAGWLVGWPARARITLTTSYVGFGRLGVALFYGCEHVPSATP